MIASLFSLWPLMMKCRWWWLWKAGRSIFSVMVAQIKKSFLCMSLSLKSSAWKSYINVSICEKQKLFINSVSIVSVSEKHENDTQYIKLQRKKNHLKSIYICQMWKLFHVGKSFLNHLSLVSMSAVSLIYVFITSKTQQSNSKQDGSATHRRQLSLSSSHMLSLPMSALRGSVWKAIKLEKLAAFCGTAMSQWRRILISLVKGNSYGISVGGSDK